MDNSNFIRVSASIIKRFSILGATGTIRQQHWSQKNIRSSKKAMKAMQGSGLSAAGNWTHTNAGSMSAAQKAIASDWKKIGGDMTRGVIKYDRQLTKFHPTGSKAK